MARGTTHRDPFGEAHLPRLIDKQPIEALHILTAREEEGRAADHIGAGEDQVIIGRGPVNGTIPGIAIISAGNLVGERHWKATTFFLARDRKSTRLNSSH